MIQQPLEVELHNQAIRGMAYRPDTTRRVPAVLFLHGFTGQRSEAMFTFVQLSRALASRGVAAVTFDFRNSGESDGSFDQMLVSGELADAMKMTEWLQGQPFADRTRLGLLGFSLGGLLAACVCGRTPAYKALVLMAPTTARNLADNACNRDSNNCPAGEPLVIGPYVMHKDFISDTLKHDPVADVVRNPRPTLLVQGTEDRAVKPEVSQPFVDAMRKAGVPVKHELIQGAEHTFFNPTARKRLLDVVTEWLPQTLGS